MRLGLHRRRTGRIAIAAVVVTALSLGLTGSSVGARAAGSTPVQRTALSAGLADVQTVHGVAVFDEQPPDNDPPVDRVIFAVDAKGDDYFDVRYRPDLAAKRQTWIAQHKTAKHSDTDPQFEQTAAALTRRVLVTSSATGLQQTMSWSVDPFTGKVIAQRYRFYAGMYLQVPLTERVARSATLVWLLSSALDTQLPDHGQSAVVSPATIDAGPGWRITVRSGGRPAYTAYVDRYGLTERVTSLGGSHELEPYPLVSFHLERLSVNRPLPAGVFTMRPSYRYAPDGYSPRKPTDTPAKYGIDLHSERAFPGADLTRYTSSWTLLPSWLPSGFRLSQTVGSDDEWLALYYRRGLQTIRVGTTGRRPTWVADRGLRHGFAFGHVSDWGVGGWAGIGSHVTRLRSGALTGWPAGSGPQDVPGFNFMGTVASGVSGNLPVATLRRVVESLRQAKPGPDLPVPTPVWPVWIVLAFAGAVLAVALRARVRRGQSQTARAARARRWLLGGEAATAVGATLSWHALYGGANQFSVIGWSEPLAVLCVAAALLAGAAALWPIRTHRQAVAARVLAAGLGLASLVAALVALVYLPLMARFTITEDPNLVMKWTSIHAVAAYLTGKVCPAPGFGLYLSIAGAVIVVVAALRLWPPQPTVVVED